MNIKKHRGCLAVGSIFFILMLGYMICSLAAVSRYVDRFNAGYWAKADAAEREHKEQLWQLPGYSELLKKKGVLEAMVKVAAKDSITLFLNLPDSVAQLMIKGVAVRTVPIREIQWNALFRRADLEALYAWLAQPMRVTANAATIPKEPINVVVAPKDSSDIIPRVTPDTTHREPVFIRMQTDKNVQFYFYQMEGGTDHWYRFVFDLRERWKVMKRNWIAILQGKMPEYIPELGIGLSKVDAKVLYRALPWNGYIVVTY